MKASKHRFFIEARNRRQAKRAQEFAAALTYEEEDAHKAAAHRYAAMVAEDPHTCCNGHRECAAGPGGRCLDEVLSHAGL